MFVWNCVLSGYTVILSVLWPCTCTSYHLWIPAYYLNWTLNMSLLPGVEGVRYSLHGSQTWNNPTGVIEWKSGSEKDQSYYASNGIWVVCSARDEQRGLDSYGRDPGSTRRKNHRNSVIHGEKRSGARHLFRSYWSCTAGFLCRLLRRRIANRRVRKVGNTLFTSIQLQEERLPQLDQL
jgi:hypothetical protein